MTDSIPDTAASALYDVLLSLCDDLPGEPPALLAWSPSRLAEVIAAGLAENGYAITRAASERLHRSEPAFSTREEREHVSGT